jgi:hypothetical protein
MTPQEMRERLRKALARSHENYTIEDLEQELATGRAMLWAGERCALVSTLEQTPTHRFLHLWLGAGNLSELISLEPGVNAHARALGCAYTSIDGRLGWSRVLRKRGFEVIDGELRKML